MTIQDIQVHLNRHRIWRTDNEHQPDTDIRMAAEHNGLAKEIFLKIVEDNDSDTEVVRKVDFAYITASTFMARYYEIERVETL